MASPFQNGCDCLKNVPTVVDRGGVEKHIEPRLWPKEEQALNAFAEALKEMLRKVAG